MHKYELFDRSLDDAQLTERYIKFRDVQFGLAPVELWPRLFNELLEFEHMIAGS